MVVFRRSGGTPAFEAAFQPALGEKQRLHSRAASRRVLVECHHDIGSDGALGVDDVFGGEEVARAVVLELKRHPSSVLGLRHCASENTWKPPLSVSIGLSHVQKRWTPPAASMTSMPGRR